MIGTTVDVTGSSTQRVLETLLSFVIAVASDEIVERVETFHRRRHQLGIYAEDVE